MSPEQAEGKAVDSRSDIFSLGVMLHEMATAQRPFRGDSSASIISAILRDEPQPVTELRPDLPAGLNRIIKRCLAKDPSARYQSALDLGHDLRELTGSDAEGGRKAVMVSAPGRLMLVAAAIAVVLLVAGTFWITRREAAVAPGHATSVVSRSIAVIPFVDLSTERSQEYFTVGLAEELVNRLARLPDLRVAAYKLQQNEEPQAVNARSIGEQMHVGTVLQGSVTKAGDRVRIRIQLVKLPDGENLWGETYDRRLDDIFAVQDEIARAIASALQVKLLGAARSANARSPEAYNLLLQARYLRKKGEQGAYAKALELLQQAARLDPGNAQVFAQMSWVYMTRASYGFAGDAEYGEAWRAANHAVELDPTLADAHLALGWFNMTKNWDWAAADASFKKALAVEPSNVTALRSAAALAGSLGRFDEAIGLGQRAAELNPTDAEIYYNLAIMQRKAGQLDAALINGRRAIELDPNLAQGHFQIGANHLLKGNVDDAMREFEKERDEASRSRGLAMGYHSAGHRADSERHLRELVARHRDDCAREIAQVYAWRNEKDRAFEWLDRAYGQRDIGLAEIKGDPLFRNVQRDSRWTAFLTDKMKLPE